MLPKHNTLSNCNDEARNILCLMDLEDKKIHACPNNCLLYKDEFVALKVYSTYGLSWFRKTT